MSFTIDKREKWSKLREYISMDIEYYLASNEGNTDISFKMCEDLLRS